MARGYMKRRDLSALCYRLANRRSLSVSTRRKGVLMAVFLYRVGGFSFRRRRLVAGVWAVVLIVLAITAGTLKGPTSDVFNVPGTEGQRALDLLREKFPGTGGATARIVFAAPAGHT